MEAPVGYALDALASTRGNPLVRALPFGGTMYTTFWRSGSHVGWPDTLAEYEAMDHPQFIKDAVKSLLVQFRSVSGTAYLTYDLKDTLEEFLSTMRLEAARPMDGRQFTEVQTPGHYLTVGQVAEELRANRPDLTIEGVTAHSHYVEAYVSLNPDHWTPIQMRFATDAGFGGTSRVRLGDAQQINYLFAVGPRGGVTDISRGNPTPTVQQNGTLDRQVIEARLEDARAQYRARVLSRIRRGPQADDEFEAKRAAHREKTAANLTAFRARPIPSHEMVIPTLPFVGHGFKASRTWGIEIETGAGRDITVIPTGWDRKGDGSLESAYDGYYNVEPDRCPDYAEYHMLDEDDDDYQDPDYCDSCGEVWGGGYSSGDCVEVVSPILSSMHSAGLESLCNDLEFAPRTDSAGIHVHVEARDLTVGQIRELVLSYDHLEPLIESSYDRVERGYCKRRSTRELLEVVRDAQREPQRRAAEVRTGDRYVTVNLQSLSYHGTVEFRAMGPRYNYDHLVRWAMFCREMVNVAKAGARSKDFAKVRTFDDVTAIFAKYGSEYRLAAGVEEAAEELLTSVEV